MSPRPVVRRPRVQCPHLRGSRGTAVCSVAAASGCCWAETADWPILVRREVSTHIRIHITHTHTYVHTERERERERDTHTHTHARTHLLTQTPHASTRILFQIPSPLACPVAGSLGLQVVRR
ncbi:hypothetical protein K431DRAFT_135680 [Polychaeton citri CBS 116435]|uniref:Uncharacterized protein n=1 Tax=Polychaeton citri CBS 116435 TaxID=1314669 RepID=A0A9P4ULG1_9PEZI|nr:hypothetical protein K431DRAFT_135680 [Polychaeton citri CBS 116435]